jgi:hypothetical protein
LGYVKLWEKQGFEVLFRFKKMDSKPDAKAKESEILAVLDYDWNLQENKWPPKEVRRV